MATKQQPQEITDGKIKELFVSYKVSKAVRRKGFNEPCIAQYLTDKSDAEGKLYPAEITCSTNPEHDSEGYPTFSVVTNSEFKDVPQYVAAPLVQQVCEWLFTKFQIHIDVTPRYGSGRDGEGKGLSYHWEVYLNGKWEMSFYEDTRTEAYNSGILEAIGILKKKK